MSHWNRIDQRTQRVILCPRLLVFAIPTQLRRCANPFADRSDLFTIRPCARLRLPVLRAAN